MRIFGNKQKNRGLRSLFRSKKSAADAIAELDATLTVWPWDDDQMTTPMKIATVYRCVKLLSESVAQLPLQLLRRGRDGVFRPMTDSWLSYLLEIQPMESMSAFDYWKQAVQQILCHGNAYLIKMMNRANYEIDRLVLCSPGSCTWNPYRRIYMVDDAIRGLRGEYAPSEVIHLKGMSADGETGMSVLEFARISTQIADAGDRETRDRFRNGGNVRGFFTNQPAGVTGYNPYNDKALKQAAETKDSFFRAGGRLSYLPGGMQFKELMLSSADMQFLESRKFTVRELCRFFGVHPSFVFDDTSNNYKSAEMANVAFLSNTLNPLLVQIEQELRRKLLTPKEAMKSRFEFGRHSLFACDLETKVKWQTARISAGLDTLNEARRAENRPAVEDGDRPLVSANLRPLSEIHAQAAGSATDANSKTDKNFDTDEEREDQEGDQR